MLERVWRKGNPLTLLVGIQTGKATMENSLEIPYKTGNAATAAAESLQSCPTLCNPVDGSPLGSAVPGILQARTGVGCHFLLQCTKVKSKSEVTQSRLTLSDPMDCSLPGSSVHGIFQARVLEWGAIAFSKYCMLPLLLSRFSRVRLCVTA